MKNPVRLIGLLPLLGGLLALSACEKVVDPDHAPIYAQRVLLTVDPADTVVGALAFRKIRFQLDLPTWNPAALGEPALIRFYAATAAQNERWVGDAFLPTGTPLDTGDRVVYRNAAGRLDTLNVTFQSFILDPLDSNLTSELRYSAVAITGLVAEDSGRIFSGGFAGERSGAPPVAPGIPMRLVLANGDVNTASNVVSLGLSFDTTAVRRLVFYQYSAILPLNSVDSLRDYFSGNSNFGGRSKYEKRAGSAGQPDSIYIYPDSTKPFIKAPAGLVKKRDTVIFDPTVLAARGFSLTYSTDGRSVRLQGTDTLLPGPGKKWMAVQRLSGSNARIGTLLYDDIEIRPHYMYLKLDKSWIQDLAIDSMSRRICVLSDPIPFHFHTYGDPTFSDTIFFWVATRKNMNRFFDGNNDGKMGKSYYSCSYTDPAVTVLECIFETPPEPFPLDGAFQVRNRLLQNFDFRTGYRVSPMGVLNQLQPGLTAENIKIAGTLPGIDRTSKDPVLLGFQVKKGSILGYAEDSLDAFTKQEIRDISLTSISSEAPGWYTAKGFAELSAPATLNDYFLSQPRYSGRTMPDPYMHAVAAQLSMDLEGRLYQHDIRGLALTTDSVSSGAKEFVLVAYARGRYFGEPRIAISRLNEDYAYVWDKIPPQFAWITDDVGTSPFYDPAVNTEYAPMCQPGRCTDFTRLGGRFDVFLSTGSLRDRVTSVRDAGFGRIRSVRLLFNYKANFLQNDALTGQRRYATPDITFDLPPEAIDQQALAYYLSGTIMIGQSYALTDLSFRDIDYSGWQSGLWDMWVETEDDLGNRGVAPYATETKAASGLISLRQLEIRK